MTKKAILKDRALELRKKQAPAEILVWSSLRNRRLNGFKFRRQFVIPPYIVDFICFEKNLIIELDGGQHMETINYDKKRDAFLESKNYKILRYWNNDIFDKFDAVLSDIVRHLES